MDNSVANFPVPVVGLASIPSVVWMSDFVPGLDLVEAVLFNSISDDVSSQD